MSETIIDGKYYAEAGAFVTSDASRYALRAIRIEPHPDGGAVIVATDGHTMGVFHDKYATCSEPVTVEFRKEILPFLRPPRAHKRASQILRCVQINGNLDVVNASFDHKQNAYVPSKTLVTFFDSICGEGARFPDWRAVMPKTTPPLRSDFNADYLHRFAMLKRERSITIWHDEKCVNVAIVRNAYRDDFVGLVMPVRGGDHPAYPAYVQPLLEAPKVEPKPEVKTADKPKQKKRAA